MIFVLTWVPWTNWRVTFRKSALNKPANIGFDRGIAAKKGESLPGGDVQGRGVQIVSSPLQRIWKQNEMQHPSLFSEPTGSMMKIAQGACAVDSCHGTAGPSAVGVERFHEGQFQ